MNKIIIWVIVIVVVVAAVIIGVNMTNKPSQQPVSLSNSEAASLALTNLSGGTVDVGQLQHVNWTSSNYGAPTVSMNIIRKVSDNPARYELVRTVALATANDGSAVWVPAKTDVGTSDLVQVGCALTSQACTAGVSGSPLAVIDNGMYANTAAAYQAIEQLNNK